MIDAGIHRVTSWKLGKRERLPTGYYCRDLTIWTERGETIQLTLFADDRNKLAPLDAEKEQDLIEQAKEEG